jgi:hypothetical protein
LTAAEGRKFAFTVGGAFLVLGAVTAWRGHSRTATVLTIVAGSLLIAGLAIPTHLGGVERAWMRLAHAISRVTTPIVTALMYFVVLTPVGILRRTFGRNPLVHQPGTAGYWRPHPKSGDARSRLERQF